MRTIEVGISATTRRRCLNGLTIPSNYHTAIMDSGADTCIIGKGWHVLEEHPMRCVKVVGFDKELETKSNLPFVTAMSVFEGPKMSAFCYRSMRLFSTSQQIIC